MFYSWIKGQILPVSAGTASVGEHSSDRKYSGTETTMNIFSTHYQHPHTNQKGRLCHFLMSLNPTLPLHEMGQGWHLSIPQWV